MPCEMARLSHDVWSTNLLALEARNGDDSPMNDALTANCAPSNLESSIQHRRADHKVGLSPLICLMSVCVLLCSIQARSCADTLSLTSGEPITGMVLQTNGENILFLTDYGTFRFALTSLKAIKIDRATVVEPPSANRLPDFKALLLLLSKQPWAVNLEQIQSTV